MSDINILYIYDASSHCRYVETLLSTITNETFDSYSCSNPIRFITNMGILSITNIEVNIEILYTENEPTHSESRFVYDDQGFYTADAFGYSFIFNQGSMTITNAKIINTIAYNFIHNQFELSISNISVLQSQGEYNPNSLHSKTIISQSGTKSTYCL